MMYSIWIAPLALLLLWILSSLFTRLSGSWSDEQRIIHIRQYGPYIRGWCSLSGGYETYRGWIFPSWIIIKRRSYGTALLEEMGFPQDKASLAEGKILGIFHFTKTSTNQLDGTFHGRRISFKDDPARIDSINPATPSKRCWQRSPA